MIRWIIMHDAPYEGMWPVGEEGTVEDPLTTYATREEAEAVATSWGMRSPKGRRDDSAILAVQV